MTTISQLGKAALALPEVEEGTHFGMVSFAVRGKGFVSVTKDGAVQLQLSDDAGRGRRRSPSECGKARPDGYTDRRQSSAG